MQRQKIPVWLSQSQNRLKNEKIFKSADAYCMCQNPDDGSLMIQYDSCDNWYYGACVAITQDVAHTL